MATDRAADADIASNEPTAVALLLGIPVDDVTMEETIDRVFWLVGDGRASRRTHQVATVNVVSSSMPSSVRVR